VVAIDANGQQDWDQTPLYVASERIQGDIQITSSYSGKTFTGGHSLPKTTWSGSANGTTESFIFLESDGGLISNLIPSITPAPMVSTDTARQVVISYNNSNDIKWFFSSDYFSIRPDPRLGLRPPTVTLTSPISGDSFNGNGTVPIRWTASAQQGLHSFDIDVSTDGGRTFHYVVTNLLGSSRSYDWQLPASTGISDVRVRVIARDRLFQNSSAGASTVFSILP
jgi:hypothetical protein